MTRKIGFVLISCELYVTCAGSHDVFPNLICFSFPSSFTRIVEFILRVDAYCMYSSEASINVVVKSGEIKFMFYQ